MIFTFKFHPWTKILDGNILALALMIPFDLFDIKSCLLGFVDTSVLLIQKHDTHTTRDHVSIMRDVEKYDNEKTIQKDRAEFLQHG